MDQILPGAVVDCGQGKGKDQEAFDGEDRLESAVQCQVESEGQDKEQGGPR